MKIFSRRDLLRGLGTCSALAALSPRLRAVVEPAAQATGAVQMQINVVLHGMFVVDYTQAHSGSVFLHAPDVSPEHVYMAGSWLKEQNIVKNQHSRLLPKLTGGTDAPNPRDCAVFAPNQVKPNYQLAYCHFQLPVPNHISCLRAIGNHGMKFFTGPVAPRQNPSSLPTVMVFSYTFNQVAAPVELQQLSWTPVVNLHLWASPPTLPHSGHVNHAVDMMAKMLGVPGEIKLNSKLGSYKPPDPDKHPPVVGLSHDEEEDLIERPLMPFHTKDGSLHNCFSAFVY